MGWSPLGHQRLARNENTVTLRVIPQHPRTTPEPVEVQVKGPLLAGPVGAHLAVFDYNRDLDRLLPAARPRRDGSFPAYDPSDLRFHQLNAYAIASRAIELVESELGRSVGWGFEASRLILLPHAGHLANAFYSEDTQTLQFYSFTLPDGDVYHTSLVHDIVAHETGHALLDAVRDRYTDAYEPETAALHEAVGDLTAVFAALSHEVVREKLLEGAGEDLRKANAVAAIAEEFEGDETRGRLALRDLTGKPRVPSFEGVTEPHDLSLKLTRAVWEALVRMYEINRKLGEDPGHALEQARRVLQRMVVRALDYLPPADATFMEFARAVLRSDLFANPDDERGYRPAVARAFVARGLSDLGPDVLESSADDPWPGRPPNWPRLTPTEAYLFLDGHRHRLALHPYAEYRDFVIRHFHVTTRAPTHEEIDEVIFVYEYPVDVELKEKRFGSLGGKWVTIWGGGTLVFDAEGRLRHHAEKPVTRARAARALEFLASAALASGLTVVHPIQDDQLRREAARRPYLAEISSDGGVTLRTNPSARCGGRPSQRRPR